MTSVRKVKLFFPKLREEGKPPTIKNTIPIDEQINEFISILLGYPNMAGQNPLTRHIVDVKYEFQYIINDKYEGEFERALLIYEEVQA
jgi:hypothetical protein